MLNNQNDEKVLWDSFILGDKTAYAAVYRLYYPRLVNYGKKFVLDTDLIEDCTQEIFVQFWLNRQAFANVQSMRSYLFVSFRRALLQASRQAMRSVRLVDEAPAFSLEASIDQVLIDRERLYERNISLKSALDRLTDRQKEAVFLMFYENMSYDEIAAILQVSKKATYKLMARAVAELRATYKENIAFWLVQVPIFISGLLCF